jgi:PKD repeat protein
VFSNSSQNAQSYTWNFGDGATQYGLSPTHTYSLVTMSGPVNDQLIARVFKMAGSGVKVTDSKSWTTNVQICNVGLTENSLESKLAVYPNPATDKVVVYLNNANSNTTIQLLNALGQVVYTKNNVSDRNEISTASLAQGVYFVRVTNGKEVATTKLVINN